MSDLLHAAVKAGNKETVEKLISFGEDVNFVSNHKSPLMYCLDTDIANSLLLNGADVKLKSGDRNLSALLNLFLNDDTDKECNNQKIKTTDEMFEVTLELTKLYLNHGANINDKDSEVFLKFPIDVNVPCSSTGLTALHLAAKNNDTDMLCLLVIYKADLDVVDTQGNTALMNALKSSGKKKDSILFLLDSSLNINNQNKDGKTAIMIAAEMSMTGVVTLLRKELIWASEIM
ncbi:fibronectin type 3 and ankyrin repeat domains 1 protein-like [Biomphalaria glabrata]|uniref:Fibronectin type 3 and ankyrin repeat domains 1 protein-like n=1 Tax=Biomphalaria glabrata TaxID=6526 RepID=A0A9W3A593_BIOGL|nr:fibronectin type 3 and ankyrin repeat domains 1 protein-like [Biomphalaria glabrata]